MSYTHEFGIMPRIPQTGERYDDYEPQKFGCIAIDADRIDEILEPLAETEFFWHTVDVRGMGLACCGITLIPPQSAEKMLEILPRDEDFLPLIELLEKAVADNSFVIHYGL